MLRGCIDINYTIAVYTADNITLASPTFYNTSTVFQIQIQILYWIKHSRSHDHSPKEKHLKVTVCLLPNTAFII
jgi:hypothetical protein